MRAWKKIRYSDILRKILVQIGTKLFFIKSVIIIEKKYLDLFLFVFLFIEAI